jgi:hypothetical protein
VGCNMPPEPPVATCVPWILSKTAMLGNTNWACEIKYQSNLHYLIYDLFAKIWSYQFSYIFNAYIKKTLYRKLWSNIIFSATSQFRSYWPDLV